MSIEVKVSLEWLKQVHRDLDACQKVIWLAGCRPQVPGGFDPAYVTGAQARLQEIVALIATGQQLVSTQAAQNDHDLSHWASSLKCTWPVEPLDPEGAWMIGSIDDHGDGDQTHWPVITVEADQYDAPGDSEKIAKALSALWQRAFSDASPEAKPALPPMNEALLYILGRPNFMCYGVAQSLRKLGHSIPNRTEDEQAHVIHWMLNSYLLHGDGWLGACNTEIASLNASAGSTNE